MNNILKQCLSSHLKDCSTDGFSLLGSILLNGFTHLVIEDGLKVVIQTINCDEPYRAEIYSTSPLLQGNLMTYVKEESLFLGKTNAADDFIVILHVDTHYINKITIKDDSVLILGNTEFAKLHLKALDRSSVYAENRDDFVFINDLELEAFNQSSVFIEGDSAVMYAYVSLFHESKATLNCNVSVNAVLYGKNMLKLSGSYKNSSIKEGQGNVVR